MRGIREKKGRFLDHAWRLPWGRYSVPHAVLDINRGCNITCAACYNRNSAETKSLERIKDELADLKRRRKLSSISILGGEPTLHPDLCEIIRTARDMGILTELVTNGLLLDKEYLQRLKEAGISIIYLHIEKGQSRADLPSDPSPDDVARLRNSLAERIAQQGIDVGFSVTAFPDRIEDVRTIVEETIQSPYANYLLVTLFRDVDQLGTIQGDITAGMRRVNGAGLSVPAGSRLDNHLVGAKMLQDLGISPFGMLESNMDRNDPRWLSYLLGVASDHQYISLQPSLFERTYLRVHYLFRGRYPMYQRQNTRMFRKQLFLNAISGGKFRDNIRFLKHADNVGGEIRAKRLLFQNPANVNPDGRVVHCRNCPDAVLKKGRLVPVCICDNIQNPITTDSWKH